MRLIDADELQRIIESYNNNEVVIIKVIDAIPVKWIRKYEEDDDLNGSIYRMLEAWEEQNNGH